MNQPDFNLITILAGVVCTISRHELSSERDCSRDAIHGIWPRTDREGDDMCAHRRIPTPGGLLIAAAILGTPALSQETPARRAPGASPSQRAREETKDRGS